MTWQRPWGKTFPRSDPDGIVESGGFTPSFKRPGYDYSTMSRPVQPEPSAPDESTEPTEEESVPDDGPVRVIMPDGREATRRRHDPSKHTDEAEGNDWDRLADDPGFVGEYLPDFMQESLRGDGKEEQGPSVPDEPGSVDESAEAYTYTSHPPSGKGLKFAWEKQLRGRMGKGPQHLTARELAALFVLGTYADENLTKVRPGRERLKRDMGYSGKSGAKTVGEILTALERKSFIVPVSRDRGRVTVYRLTTPEWEQSSSQG